MDRFLPDSINYCALHKSKSLLEAKRIDLFDDTLILEPSSTNDMFNDCCLIKKSFLKSNTVLKKRIIENRRTKINYEFQSNYFKVHGQKHWINLKESFNNKKKIADVLKIFENNNILRFNTNCYTLKSSHLNFSTVLTTNHEQETKHLKIITPFKILDAPHLRNDFYSNLLSWSAKDKLAVGLNDSVYTWSQKDSETKLLLHPLYLNKFQDIVTCVSYSPSLKDDLICCGTKNGKVFILRGNDDMNNKCDKFISIFSDNEKLKYLLCESIGNSKGICTIKWLLKKIDLKTAEEEWAILCGNENGEVVCFDLQKIYETHVKPSSGKYIMDTQSIKATSDEYFISTMRSNNPSLDPFSNSFATSVIDDLVSVSESNTDIWSLSRLDSHSNLDFTHQSMENVTSLNLTTRSFNEINNNIFTANDITNVSVSDKKLNNYTSKPSKSNSTTETITKIRFELQVKTFIKCQSQQLCGMDFSCEYNDDGCLNYVQLAVGGNDNSCTVWDITNFNKPVLLYDLPHTAAVKAVQFCPWLKNLLATGGGSKDRHIRIWHTKTGTIIKQYKTAAQITSLLWSKHKMELMLTFGFGNPEQPVLMKTFKYPSMQLVNHIKSQDHMRALSSALSPNFSTLALAINDETIKLFKISTPKKTILKHRNNTDIYQSTFLNSIEQTEIFDSKLMI
ncbi:hypothetical protein QEN19_002569 [Hanseniaspora menglaensis]